MFNGSRFFSLARKWKKEGRNPTYFFILKDVMDHYFGSLVSDSDSYELIINGKYPVADISSVLDAVGYRNYSIELGSIVGKTVVKLQNTL